MTLSDEQIQDLLRVGNPTDEECRLIRMGWDAAIAEIRAQPVGWVDAGDVRVLKHGNSVWLNPDDEGQMIPVYLAALEAKAMTEQDLMTTIAAIITDMHRIEYDINDPMRHCKGSAKRLAGKILSDAAQQARDALLVVNEIGYAQSRAESDAEAKP